MSDDAPDLTDEGVKELNCSANILNICLLLPKLYPGDTGGAVHVGNPEVDGPVLGEYLYVCDNFSLLLSLDGLALHLDEQVLVDLPRSGCFQAPFIFVTSIDFLRGE